MTGRSLGFLAATAALAAFGGLHLEIASGRGLDRPPPGDARLVTGTTIAVTGINRSAKRDRDKVSLSDTEDRTITFQHPDVPSTTVAVRMRETARAAKRRPDLNGTPKARRPPAAKSRQTVACEGVVSALTDVAKQLEAGRCVT